MVNAGQKLMVLEAMKVRDQPHRCLMGQAIYICLSWPQLVLAPAESFVRLLVCNRAGLRGSRTCPAAAGGIAAAAGLSFEPAASAEMSAHNISATKMLCILQSYAPASVQMEVAVTASVTGKVAAVRVEAGQLAQQGDVLAVVVAS